MEDEEMSDSEMWEQHRLDGQEKRWSNKEKSLKLLKQQGIDVICVNEYSTHYKIGDYNFWPTTGVYYNQKTKDKGRGVFNLIKIIKQNEKN